MTVKLSPLFNDQTLNENGNLAVGYQLFVYAAVSSAKQAVYTDNAGSIPHSNPIILDARGYPEMGPIWLTSGQNHKFVLARPDDTDPPTSPIKTIDNVAGINDANTSTSQWQSSGVTPTYISASSFSVPGDQTTEFHVGRRIQATISTGTVYGTIQTSAFASSLTTVTAALDSGSLDAGLSTVNLSILRADFPALPNSAAARATLGLDTMIGTAGSVSHRNKLINGGAEVAQDSAKALTTSPQYGQVDMCALWASGGAVSAGNITQNTAATVGRTGKAARAAGVTLTGSGQVSWRYRMEAADAVKFKNQSASFRIAVLHDVGSSINYTVIIRKANAADNFSATTVIDTGSATAVATGTGIVLKRENVALGDCSNGLEIEVQAACGAVTAKNFDFTEWQFEEGAKATTFERRHFGLELALCQRYYRRSGGQTIGQAVTSTLADIFFKYEVEMRATPTVGILNTSPTLRVAGSSGAVAGTWSALSTGTKQVLMQFVRTTGTWTAGAAVNVSDGSDVLEFSARL